MFFVVLKAAEEAVEKQTLPVRWKLLYNIYSHYGESLPLIHMISLSYFCHQSWLKESLLKSKPP